MFKKKLQRLSFHAQVSSERKCVFKRRLLLRTNFKWKRYMTVKDALAIADKYNLRYEVQMAMDNGCSPEEALGEWDI